MKLLPIFKQFNVTQNIFTVYKDLYVFMFWEELRYEPLHECTLLELELGRHPRLSFG